jgi:hypothetical protein
LRPPAVDEFNSALHESGRLNPALKKAISKALCAALKPLLRRSERSYLEAPPWRRPRARSKAHSLAFRVASPAAKLYA